MFWLDIPGGLAVLLVVIFLIYALNKKVVEWIKHLCQKVKDHQSQKVFDLYLQVQRLSPNDREEFLKNQSRRIQERYKYAVTLWGEPD